MAAPRLPVPAEIWIHILKQALGSDFFKAEPPFDMDHFMDLDKSSHNQYWPKPDTQPASLKDASALSLVCKDWHGILTPKLYSTLWVKTVTPSKESLARARPGLMTLGLYVRHLHVRASADPHAVYELLDVLPNLESLVFEDLPMDVVYKSSIDWDEGSEEDGEHVEDEMDHGGEMEGDHDGVDTDGERDWEEGLEGSDDDAENLKTLPESFGTIIPGAFPEEPANALSQLKTIFWGNNDVNFRPVWNSFFRSIILRNPNIEKLGLRCWLPGLFQEHNFSASDSVVFPSLTTLCALEGKFEHEARASQFSPGLLRATDFPCLETMIISPNSLIGLCVPPEDTFIGMLAPQIRTLDVSRQSGRCAIAFQPNTFPSFTHLEEMRYVFYCFGPLSIEVGIPKLTTLRIELPIVGAESCGRFDELLAHDLKLFLDRGYLPELTKVVFTGPDETLGMLARLPRSTSLDIMRAQS
ncbi:hypothetical protein HGRIS_008856 [Hohenbuehelia grisea]